jgi:hypothetical protein
MPITEKAAAARCLAPLLLKGTAAQGISEK